MSMPYLGRAFRGWTKRRKVYKITKKTINYLTVQTATVEIFDIMISPLQPEKVQRKPEEQRSWKWYNLLTKSKNTALSIDDIILVSGIYYRIESVQPWTEAGYRRYEATEDYTGHSTLYELVYDGNGSDGGTDIPTIAYQSDTEATTANNTYLLTDYVFTGWNTSSDGTGTAYSEGDTVTIGTDSITLYAQWEAEATT